MDVKKKNNNKRKKKTVSEYLFLFILMFSKWHIMHLTLITQKFVYNWMSISSSNVFSSCCFVFAMQNWTVAGQTESAVLL